jgi:hypothetical protein
MVTFTGTGFGPSQGSGIAWLGGMAGQVVSWQDTQVVAAVAPGAMSGVAKIQRSDGLSSNAFGFTVPAPGSNTVMPSLLNMVVGDTRTLQALGAGGQTVMGLAWKSSDPAVVSLSTDDPAVLTALAAGHVTITAGTGSADVTVWAGALPVGTAMWSNPGNGSGVSRIVPAVPSASGVADVFAIQNDQTVQAITSDGTVRWTADVSQAAGEWRDIIPDFQGGLVVAGWNSIWKLDGMTGQPYPAYTANNGEWFVQDGGGPVVHPDGTIFAAADPDGSGEAVVGIDSTTGAMKFSVPVPRFFTSTMVEEAYGIIIAGDGYAYFAYSYPPDPDANTRRIGVLRISSSGAYDNIDVYDADGFGCDEYDFSVRMITNADQGILLTWGGPRGPHMATITGTRVNMVRAPQVPGDMQVTPILQAQDGSFVGTLGNNDMVAFDAGGGVRWMVPNETPQIATADGGVIGASGIAYDAGGNATGSVGSLPTYSWLGYAYQDGAAAQVVADPLYVATSFWPFVGANSSNNFTANQQPWFAPLQSCPDGSTPCPQGPAMPSYRMAAGAPRDGYPSLGCPDPSKPCPQQALMSALSYLRALLRSPCPACSSYVFNKLSGTKKADFSNYLSRTPHFYDGTRSYAPVSAALCPSGFWSGFTCALAGVKQSVRDYMLAHDSDAVSQTPSGDEGMRVFFDPAAGICNVLSVQNPKAGDQGVLNQAVLFHEALHGYSGKYDLNLMSALLGVTDEPTIEITYGLEDNVILVGATGARVCTK